MTARGLAIRGRSAGRTGALARRRTRTSLFLLAPALLLLGVFFLAPLALMFWMSLNSWPLFGVIRFAGLENYFDAFGDETFWDSLWFTVRYTILITPIQVVGGYLLAMLVRGRWRGVGAFRALYFMPVVIGFAAAAYVFLALIQPGYGLLDQLLVTVGAKPADEPVLSDANLAVLVTVLLNAWKSIGIAMILFMAGMHAIPTDLYEAAQVDGASGRARERWITLPLLRRTFALVLVLTVAGSLLAFDQFYILTRGGPQGETTTAVLWIFTVSFVRFRLGYGAALSIILLVILVGITALQVRALRQEQ
jgi:multiple sugar transport system permease protein